MATAAATLEAGAPSPSAKGAKRRLDEVSNRDNGEPDLAHISASYSWCQDRGYVRDGFNPARARRRQRTDVESGEGAVSVRGVERFEQRFRPYIVLILPRAVAA